MSFFLWTRLVVRVASALLVSHFLFFQEAIAVITLAPTDAQRNITSPQGAFAGSGWELQGSWGNFLGTPISPRHFITATHVGGSIGEAFTFRGKSYVTTARYSDAGSDLSIWSVAENFPQFATLNPDKDEVGQVVIAFGRGGPRGASVQISGLLGPQPRGWLWGQQDGVMRWGLNKVAAVVTSGGSLGVLVPPGGNPNVELLKMVFNLDGGADEAHLSAGDSGGGLFIKEGNTWKLAGLHYAVDGPYNTSTVGPGFGAAIYDEGGLYKGGEGAWSMVNDLPTEQGGAFYSTRISSRLSWIESVLALPAPDISPSVQFQSALGSAFVDLADVEIDATRKVIRVPVVNSFRNYRLKFTRGLIIRNPRVEAGKLEFTYE